jgi:DNA modification methylase
MTERRLEYLPLSELKRAPNNPKQHDVGELAKSIGRFGYVEPVILDERTGRLVAGHGRLETLEALESKKSEPPKGIRVLEWRWCLPVVRGWASKDDAEANAYLLASNRTVELGGWDEAALAELLKGLGTEDALTGTGYGLDDLDEILRGITQPEPPGQDDVPEVSEADVYVKQGELWALGNHRLIVGDCRSPEVVARVLDGKRINVLVTSPPYASQRKYDESSGFQPIHPDKYVAWFKAVADLAAKHLAPDGSYFLNIKEHCEDGQRHLYVKDLTIAHVREWGWRFVDEFCWTRQGVPGGWNNRFKNGWEPIFHFSRGEVVIKFRPDAVSVPSDGVFDYSADNAKSPSGSGLLSSRGLEVRQGFARPSNVLEIGTGSAAVVADHSAAYPVALPEFFIKAFSDEGDLVFDPFMGSGTTLIAAEKNGRTAAGVEISPRYAQVIIERWEKFTSKKADRVE